MNYVGFVEIDKNATTCHGAKNPGDFIGKICAVLEFDSDGGALVVNPQQNAAAMFEKQDIRRKFECIVSGNTICPPNQSEYETLMYVSKCATRKGGYNNILANMVVHLSLMKGKFTDDFLWQLQ